MAIEVKIPTILRTYTAGEKAVTADGRQEVVVAGHQPPATAGSTTTWSPSLISASRPPMNRTSSSLT